MQPARQRKKGTTLHLSEFAGEAAGSLAAHKKREAAAEWAAAGGGGGGNGGGHGFEDILEGGTGNGDMGGEVGCLVCVQCSTGRLRMVTVLSISMLVVSSLGPLAVWF